MVTQIEGRVSAFWKKLICGVLYSCYSFFSTFVVLLMVKASFIFFLFSKENKILGV